MKNLSPADLRIEIAQGHDEGIFRWLLASFLMGKRIRSTVAVQAFHTLVEHGLATPGKLTEASHTTLVRLLGEAGYARYDESTARRLNALAIKFDTEARPYLQGLREGNLTREQLKRWLLGFDGIGPKTVEIFMSQASDMIGVEHHNA